MSSFSSLAAKRQKQKTKTNKSNNNDDKEVGERRENCEIQVRE